MASCRASSNANVMDFFLQQHTKKQFTLKQQKVYAAILQDTTKDSQEKKLEKVFWSSILTKSKFERGVGVWVIIKSNSCNSQWNSALAILIVRVDNDLNEREQIDLRLVCFFNKPLLLFCFLKLVLTFNNVRGSLECNCCKFS